MRHALPLLIATLALAGCDKTGAGGNNSQATAKTAAAVPVGIKPGKWENQIEVLDIAMEGAPQEVLDKAKSTQTVVSCVTDAQAAKGPSSAMLEKGNCKVAKYEAAGGHVASEVSCSVPGGQLTTRATGTYSATEYTTEGEGKMTGSMTMSMKTRTKGRWIGACTPAESAAAAKGL